MDLVPFPPLGAAGRVAIPGICSLLGYICEHVVTPVYCVNFDEEFEPPSGSVEAFRGEGDYVDRVRSRRFEVFDPQIYFREYLRASGRRVVYPSPMLFGVSALFGQGAYW